MINVTHLSGRVGQWYARKVLTRAHFLLSREPGSSFTRRPLEYATGSLSVVSIPEALVSCC